MTTSHISGDDLELYALDRLADADAAPVEEHLLLWEECQERLAGWNEYLGGDAKCSWTSRAQGATA